MVFSVVGAVYRQAWATLKKKIFYVLSWKCKPYCKWLSYKSIAVCVIFDTKSYIYESDHAALVSDHVYNKPALLNEGLIKNCSENEDNVQFNLK